MATQTVGNRLSGRRILITGGASGIGLATSRLFVEEGARIAILDQNGAAARQLAEELGQFAAEVDVADQAAVTKAVDAAAAALGGLDGLVNCAGSSRHGLAEQGDLDAWEFTMSVNLRGPFLVTAAALPYLRENDSATIVNIGSGLAMRPGPGQGAYAASKAGLLAWTKVIAQEFGPNIRVNAVCPGPTDTPLLRRSLSLRGVNGIEGIGGGRALERGGEPIEQAHAILFFTGPESTFVTGVAMPVDGGRAYY